MESKFTATKAWVAAAGASATGFLTAIAASFPTDDRLQVIVGGAVGVVGAIVTGFAAFHAPYEPVLPK